MSRKVLLFACAALCYGQNAVAPKPFKIGNVVVTGSIRSRVEAWDWFQADTGDGTYAFSGNLFRISFAQSKESYDWQVEMAAPILLGLPDNAVATNATQGQLGLGATYFVSNSRSQNAANIFPKQAFVRFKNLFGDSKQSVRFGRFEFVDGAEVAPKNATLIAVKRDRISMRLIGHFGWAHVGRSFDGMHYIYNSPKNGNFTFVGGIPTRGVFQTDGWGETATGLGYAAYTKPWGKGNHSADTRVFAMYYQDWRAVLKTDNRPVAARRADTANLHIYSFGGHSIHAFDTKKGTVDLLLWGTGQTGKWGVQDHRGHAFALEGGFQPKIAPKLKPWFRVGFYDGSGDDNPNDKTHGTFFQVLPTPRPYARFPFFDMANNRDINASMILRPHKQVTISSEFHALRLSNAKDLWYLGGGAYQPWSFGYQGRNAGGPRSLANLYDTSVEYRMRPNVTLTGYYGFASGKAITQAVYPKGKNGGLGYAEVAYRF